MQSDLINEKNGILGSIEQLRWAGRDKKLLQLLLIGADTN